MGKRKSMEIMTPDFCGDALLLCDILDLLYAVEDEQVEVQDITQLNLSVSRRPKHN